MATNRSTRVSLSVSAARNLKEPLQPSRRDLASLQLSLDKDFQDFWEVRRFGSHWGMRVICPVCGDTPPIQRWAEEDYIAYGHRKWRWLSNHIVTDHCRNAALTHRHRVAVKSGPAKVSETRFAGKKTAA